jgi:hypothetical protein
MADTFSVKLPGNWRERWPEVETAAAKYSFAIERTGDFVKFAGYGIEGEIRVENNIADVVIDRRPFFIPASFIEEKVRAFLLTQY